ncbi:MAG TPA: hydroxymethylpyrimidine/phosphomethylpyrimidine kinase [Cytophagaceae bacterium]|jgi:hydroxymethylpyrimidine/phosphomethylpyrimidine kinase
MQGKRKVIMSIAGFDPSGGAGILSDIKTIEAHKIYGLGITSAITFQNDDEFTGVNWLSVQDIERQIELQTKKFKIEGIKIGLVESLDTLETLVVNLREYLPKVPIVWDPILKASAGFEFHKGIDSAKLENILTKVTLITPNWNEASALSNSKDSKLGALEMSRLCMVYLKGGHNEGDKGRDYLFHKGEQNNFKPKKIIQTEKHGSGCVLSTSLLCNLVKGYPLIKACLRAKDYTAHFLNSNKTLLGYHKI